MLLCHITSYLLGDKTENDITAYHIIYASIGIYYRRDLERDLQCVVDTSLMVTVLRTKSSVALE